MKRKLVLTMLALQVGFCAWAQSVRPAIKPDANIEKQVKEQLSKMSLDDKVGQMCEITIDAITDFSKAKTGFALSAVQTDTVLSKYRVGSILNVPLSVAQTPKVWRTLISELNRKSMAVNGIPQVYGVDQIHGATYTMGATFFPQPIVQAASFNKNIPFRVAEVSAYESRACLIPWVYAPVMDLGRNPNWPRMWESFGEDDYVNSVMAVQAVKGYQGPDPNHIDMNHVAVSIKHFMAYGVPVTGKDRTPSMITERELKERYFEPFKHCVENGALTLMVNSASNNGVPFHANKKLLTDWLKDGLNWDGMIVTDWADINNLYTREHVAADKKHAIAMAINAGIDMSMDPYSVDFCTLLKQAVNEGLVPMSRIDDAVSRILRFKYRVGLFDKKTWDKPERIAKNYPDFASSKFAAEATRFAEEGEVLLKNEDGILPLKKDTRILVAGPNANTLRGLNGGWSYTWQGDKTDQLVGDKYNSIYKALANKFGAANVTLAEGVRYKAGSDWEAEDASDLEKAVAAAGNSDVIVACVGENSYCETPGNFNSLMLSENQRHLVKALAKTGKPIVLVLNGGRPRIINDIVPLSKAVVDVMLPGNYGGDALANLLAGDCNFSGKLPFTYPRTTSSLHTYDYKVSENQSTMAGNYNYDAKMDVQWPFGAGLSYTTFKYSNLRVNKTSFDVNDELTVSVDVTNSGQKAGKEAVLLYFSDVVASLVPDNRNMCGFDKIDLQPGETKTVTLKVPARSLAFVNSDMKWALEEGEFLFHCGNQQVKLNCTKTATWE
ncbi:glycosyl hydrolase family 3 protein [Prevotella sp. DNF00663]|uniref:glycoside hydrolase family 3 N-terminal domain-containing protein n=1 Tax=Prevotella sp. DNF00663 TaxID=1384078 RepID=UPI000781697F|nr:glycoside hydrolase family 3 N-terminal domain-containing protein [Prevotella sp. DNF00663]KXB85986.1 glycosyl hydrolase family 3 protein [Prevotella sp. DNF00663]